MGSILYLTLFRKWFDEILEGKKKIEYRDKKEYWKKRLFNQDGSVKNYDKIVFTNGYGSNRPRIEIKFLGVKESQDKYEIILGDIINKLN